MIQPQDSLSDGENDSHVGLVGNIYDQMMVDIGIQVNLTEVAAEAVDGASDMIMEDNGVQAAGTKSDTEEMAKVLAGLPVLEPEEDYISYEGMSLESVESIMDESGLFDDQEGSEGH